MPRKASICWRASVPIVLSIEPPRPIRMPFWFSRSTRMEAWMRTRPSSSLNGSITTPVDVGDLLAGVVQDPLADHLRHEEALGQVGQEVLGVERGTLRAA